MHKNKQKRPNSQIIKSALCFGAALIFFLLYILLCSTGSDVVLTGLVIVVCYILTVTLFEVLYHILFVKYKKVSEEEQRAVSDITRELLIRLSMPVIICDGQGKIIWHNKLFSDIFDEDSFLAVRSIFYAASITTA